MRKFCLPKYTLLALSVVITLFLIESLLRFFRPPFPVSDQLGLDCYKDSDYLSYEYIPGCVGDMGGGKITEINSIGLRNREIGSKFGKRILLVGDSFVFGSGVFGNEILGNALEEATNQEIISAGFINTGPDTAYLYTIKEGLKLHPDLLILALFPYNDLEDLEASVWQENDSSLTKTKRRDEVVDEHRRLVDNDKLDSPLLRQLKKLRLVQFLVVKADSVSFRLKLLELKTGIIFQPSTREFKNYQDCLYGDNCSGKWKIARAKADRILTLFKQLLKERDIPLLMVTIPFSDQVFEREPSNTLFDRLLEEKNIPFLNLQEALVSSGRAKLELYLPGGHWTPLGNIVAADAIAKQLQTLRY